MGPGGAGITESFLETDFSCLAYVFHIPVVSTKQSECPTNIGFWVRKMQRKSGARLEALRSSQNPIFILEHLPSESISGISEECILATLAFKHPRLGIQLSPFGRHLICSQSPGRF